MNNASSLADYNATTRCLSPTGSSPAGPYLLPSNYPISPSAQFDIYIPNVDGKTVEEGGGTCLINDNPDFELSWLPAEAGGTSFYAQVRVTKDNMLTDDPTLRGTLKKSFTQFRQALEKLEAKGCLVAGGAKVLAARVASSLVLRLDEVLFYYYGFDPVAGVELAPGMLLQLEAGTFQNVAPYGSALPGAELDGFAPSGQATYRVGLNSGDQTLSFNAYLRGLAPYTLPGNGAPAGNIVDLTADGMKRRYWRLIYPAQFAESTSIVLDPGLKYNVALLGADTLADLENAVAAYTGPTPGCAAASRGNAPILCVYFAGRASLVPQVPIIFMGTPLYVALGTTLRDLIERYTYITLEEDVFFLKDRNFTFWRYTSALLGAPTGYGSGPRKTSVLFDTKSNLGPVKETGLTVFDVPFVLGDHINWDW